MVNKLTLFFLALGLGANAFAVQLEPMQNPIAYIAALKAKSPALARQALEDILRQLARHPSPANNKLITELLDRNPELAAEIADTIEPAAGPAPAPGLTSRQDAFDIPLENPNQISANQP